MAESEGSSRRRLWIIVLVVVILAAATGIGVIASGTAGSKNASAAVTLEPANRPGADPFTSSVAIGPVVEFPGNVRAITSSRQHRRRVDTKTHTVIAVGTAPGLYGGSGDARVCNPAKLVGYLNANPDKAKAWASVLGIDPAGIAAYVRTLTPVVLTTDTLVTNHGYANGHATSLQSVLEAGTAVMVDATGTPRVKCNCGNPLAPPEPITVTKTQGTPWPGYSPSAVTVIRPGPPTKTLTLINTKKGDDYPQPVGNTPAPEAGQWAMAEVTSTNGYPTRSTILTSRAGRPFAVTKVLPNTGVTGIAWGNGKWLALANVNRETVGEVLESSDLHTWQQVATIPNTLVSIGFGNGRWIAAAQHVIPPALSGGIPHSQGLLYTSTDGAHWRLVPIAEYPSNFAIPPVAYGNGEWLTVVPEEQARAGAFLSLEMFTSRDGLHWTSNAGHIDGPFNASLGFGAGKWLVGSEANGQSSTDIFTSGNAVSWTPSAVGAANSDIVAVAHGNGQWMIAATGASGGISSTTFWTSANAETWKSFEEVRANVGALAFGGGTSASTPPTVVATPITVAPTTTLAPTTTIATVSAPCTAAAFSAALGPDSELDGPPQCSGTTGTIQFAAQGQHLVGKVYWNGSAWQFAKGAIPVCRINGIPTNQQAECPDANKGPFGYKP